MSGKVRLSKGERWPYCGRPRCRVLFVRLTICVPDPGFSRSRGTPDPRAFGVRRGRGLLIRWLQVRILPGVPNLLFYNFFYGHPEGLSGKVGWSGLLP